MSRPTVVAKGGLVRVTNDDLDFNNLHELVREWNFAQSAADEDWDARRVDHLERTSAVATSAADDVRDAAGFALTWQDAMALADRLWVHAAHARQQEQAQEVSA